MDKPIRDWNEPGSVTSISVDKGSPHTLGNAHSGIHARCQSN